MISNQIGMEHYHKKEWASPSAFCTLATCPRKYFYKTGCRLCSQVKPPALLFGAGIHHGIPHCYRGDIDSAMIDFMKDWGSTPEGPTRSAVRARLMFQSFIAQHIPGMSVYTLIKPPSTIEIDDRISDNEVPFAIDLGLPVPVVGRLDAVCQHRDTNDVWGLEYKTSSEMGTRFISAFNMSPQVHTYTLALRSLGVEARGTFVEGLLVAKASTNCVCFPIYLNKAVEEGLIKWYQHHYALLKHYEESGNFPQNFAACNTYSSHGSPGYPCEYESLCSVDDWTTMKDMFFVADDRPFTIKKSETP